MPGPKLATALSILLLPSLAPASARAVDSAGLAAQRLAGVAERLAPTAYPQSADPSGRWLTTGSSAWTSGFFPGSLWLLYERTGDPAWRARAERWQADLERQKAKRSTHDLGFMFGPTFVADYRRTGDTAARDVALAAAASLASRYSATVGATRSWDTRANFRVIVDNLVNLDLLFWAARNGGRPEWRDMAHSHALRSSRDHVRPDGSTVQIVDYDELTGAVVATGTKQGAGPGSTWSRGQAWAIHGLATAYRETGDARLLDAARRTADWWGAHVPADRVPPWDFTAPLTEPRDSSAAAVAASGLLELARLEPDPARATRYREEARATVASLTSAAYLAPEGDALLLHGTYNRPDGRADTGLVWGDFYLLEALARLG